MMRHQLVIGFGIATLAGLLGCAPAPPPAAPFGEEMTIPAAEVIPIETVLASPEEHDGKYMRVSGTVTDVCATRGCWMEIGSEDAEGEVFVKFTCPIDGHLIPAEAVGHRAEVEGTLEVVQISEDEARHYAAESDDPAEADEIDGPQQQFKMAAPAARIEGIEISDPAT